MNKKYIVKESRVFDEVIENGKKINYISYIKSKKNEDCNDAIKRVFGKIYMKKINDFIDEISCMTDIRKESYKKIISYRYEILKGVYNNLK